MKEQRLWKAKIGWNTALVIAGLILGFFFAAQWNITPEVTSSTLMRTREDLAATIMRLEKEQKDLKSSIDQLRRELAQQQERVASNTKLLEGLNADLEAQRMAAGLYALKGPGIRITLADSERESLPANIDPNLYLIHEYDLRDIMSFLWAADAEAVAVNEERIVGTTSIYCVGSTIMVNDTRLSPPYTILAIGDVGKLERTLTNPTYLKELRARAKTYGVQFRVAKEKEVMVPAFRGSFTVKYSKPGS